MERRQVPNYDEYWVDSSGQVFRATVRQGVCHMERVATEQGRVMLRSSSKVRSVPVEHLVRDLFPEVLENEPQGPELEHSDESAQVAPPPMGVTLDEAAEAPSGRKRRTKRRKASPKSGDAEDKE